MVSWVEHLKQQHYISRMDFDQKANLWARYNQNDDGTLVLSAI